MSNVKGASRAWEALFRSQVTIMRRLEQDDLLPELSLREYDVLFSLTYAGDTPMRLKDLNERVLMHQSSLSRLVERLVDRGLVMAHRGSTDKRELSITLTDHGAKLQREMGRKHAEQIAHYVGDALEKEELAELERLCEKLRNAQASIPAFTVSAS